MLFGFGPLGWVRSIKMGDRSTHWQFFWRCTLFRTRQLGGRKAQGALPVDASSAVTGMHSARSDAVWEMGVGDANVGMRARWCFGFGGKCVVSMEKRKINGKGLSQRQPPSNLFHLPSCWARRSSSPSFVRNSLWPLLQQGERLVSASIKFIGVFLPQPQPYVPMYLLPHKQSFFDLLSIGLLLARSLLIVLLKFYFG